jgi:hypothetical protein
LQFIGQPRQRKQLLRTEVFNIINHPNFNSPIDNSTLFNSDGSVPGNAGVIDSTSVDPRQNQFALKLPF